MGPQKTKYTWGSL